MSDNVAASTAAPAAAAGAAATTEGGAATESGEPVAKSAVVLGGKTITFAGSIALLINTVTGGGMVVFPSAFQSAGWVVMFGGLIFVAFLSSICAFMIIEAMALMPGNKRFNKRIEYTTLCKMLLPHWAYCIAQLFYQLSFLCNSISMIIQSIQVMDFTIAAMAGQSCALPEFYPNFNFHCPSPVSGDNTAFGDRYLIPLGWYITALVVLPLGFINLDDNDVMQKGGFAAVIMIVLSWIGISINQGLEPSRVKPIGDDFTGVLGAVLFNFALVTYIPSWVNEKRPNVPIVKAIGVSFTGAVLLFSALGWIGGMGFPKATNNQTILDQVYGLQSKISSVTYYLWPAAVNLTSIPVNGILQRYNLFNEGICGAKTAAFIGVVLPWLISIPLYTGSGYQLLINWAGIVLNSTVNFIIPPTLYILAIRKHKREHLIRKGSRSNLFIDAGEEIVKPVSPPALDKQPSLVKTTTATTTAVLLHQSKQAATEQNGVEMQLFKQPSKMSTLSPIDHQVSESNIHTTKTSSEHQNGQTGEGEARPDVKKVNSRSQRAISRTISRKETKKLQEDVNRRKRIHRLGALRLAKRRQEEDAEAAIPTEKPIVVPEMKPYNPFEAPKGRWNKAAWLLMLPFAAVCHYTIPHPGHHGQKAAPFTFIMASSWITGISYILVFLATQFAIVSGVNHLLVGIHVLGLGSRLSAFVLEYRGQSWGGCDLNRILGNNVWQLLIVFPLPWLLFHASKGHEFQLWSGTLSVYALSLFIMASMVGIIYRAFDWKLDGLASAGFFALYIFFSLETFLLDYNVILGLNNAAC